MNKTVKEILEWTLCVVIAVILALIIRFFVGAPTIVKQPSMYPTLRQDERLILNRWIKTSNGELKRGDIVTFESPSKTFVASTEADLSNPVAKYENEPKSIFGKLIYYVLEINKTSFIKRVIGLPGEHVKIANNKVYINGEAIYEPYLEKGVLTTSLNGAYIDIVVPEGTVFLMGDNRPKSTDSRCFGCVPMSKIESKVWIRFWPFNLFGEVK